MSYMAVDYGSRRIGIASSESGLLATPHSVLENQGDIVAALAQLAREIEADVIVIGLPVRPRSDDGLEKFRILAEGLRQQTCKEVILWNEALSTVVASENLRAAGRNRRDAQRDIDMHAAAVILQSYLDHLRAHGDSLPNGGRP